MEFSLYIRSVTILSCDFSVHSKLGTSGASDGYDVSTFSSCRQMFTWINDLEFPTTLNSRVSWVPLLAILSYLLT